LRIIGGSLRGRIVRFPALPGVRPTPDRVRETLFNWLGQDLTDLATFEPYAGSGVLSLEALSRGARLAVAIDRDRRAVDAFTATAREFGIGGLEARVADARAVLARVASRVVAVFLSPRLAERPLR